MNSTLRQFIRLATNGARYVTQTFFGVVVQLLSVCILAMAIVGIPIVIAIVIPEQIVSVREWFESTEHEGVTNKLLILADGAAFLGIVGFLGLVPYLFQKAAESIPKSLGYIGRQFLSIFRGPWVPSNSNPSHVSTLVANRIQGILRAVRGSVALIIALIVLALSVEWAAAILRDSESNGRELEAIVRVNGEIATNVTTESIQVEIRCEDASGMIVPVAEQVVSSGTSDTVLVRCQSTAPESVTLMEFSESLASLVESVGELPTRREFTQVLDGFSNELEMHLDRHLDITIRRIDQLDD